jgi:hypothetical protein
LDNLLVIWRVSIASAEMNAATVKNCNREL